MEDIIEILCKKYNLSKAQTRAIVESPFKFTTDKWRSRDLGTVKFKYLGKFGVHPNKKKWLQENLTDVWKERDERREKAKQDRRDLRRMDKSDLGESRGREESQDTSGDMC